MEHKSMVCGCGNCDDAFDAALRLFKQAYKPDGEFCGTWALMVTEFFSIITDQAAIAWSHGKYEQEGIEVSIGDVRAAIYSAGDRFTLRSYIALADNRPKTEAIAKYVCEEMGLGTKGSFEHVAEGPDRKDAVQLLERLRRDADARNFAAELAKAFGVDPSQMKVMRVDLDGEDEDRPATKPH